MLLQETIFPKYNVYRYVISWTVIRSYLRNDWWAHAKNNHCDEAQRLVSAGKYRNILYPLKSTMIICLVSHTMRKWKKTSNFRVQPKYGMSLWRQNNADTAPHWYPLCWCYWMGFLTRVPQTQRHHKNHILLHPNTDLMPMHGKYEHNW